VIIPRAKRFVNADPLGTAKLKPDGDQSVLPFEDLLGYVFRKKVANAVNLGAAHYVKGDHHSAVRQELAPRKWTGEGPLDEVLALVPFDVVIWLCSRDGAKIKIRGEMDVANHHKVIWYRGSIVDIWLKTPMLTFNRAFPDEINVFKPALCAVQILRDHRRFAKLNDLVDEFDQAYIERLSQPEKSDGTQLLRQAKLIA
jgi:hypothetical protein